MDGNKGEQPKDNTEPQISEETELARLATEITLARAGNYEELWAETEQEGDQKFIEKTKQLWKEFAVHGRVIIDRETKKPKLLNFSDIDGKCAIKLLELAGINTKNVEYVEPGTSVQGKINLDTSDEEGRYGLVIEDGGQTAFLDHHTAEAGKLTSATEITYKTLVSLGLLKREQYLDKLVGFVTQVDNCDYDVSMDDFKNSWKRLLGIQRFMSAENLLDFFKKVRNPAEDLTPTDLKKWGLMKVDKNGKLIDRSEEQRKTVNGSLVALEKMQNEGFIINSDDYGKIAVDIGKKVPAGFDAARAFGCETYVIWSPEENSFFITARKPLPDFPQGIKIREFMCLKPRLPSGRHGELLTLTLGEVLDKMTDGKIWTTATGRLKDYLEEEKKKKEQKQ